FILGKDMLEAAVIPMVRMLGMWVGRLIGGSVVIENLLGIGGIGEFVVDSIGGGDYGVVEGGVVMIGWLVVMGNRVSEVIVMWVDGEGGVERDVDEWGKKDTP
ncbi:ABC transporter permease subunit, partial [Staphylococcus pettenkoferi]|uniref:ABC transporter permease subunit n=1 Tax=Staphylococcus pettenkoferi TaxID=170573 RepID=UPI0011A40FF0